MPKYARLNADSTTVLATATADNLPGAGWLPVVINAAPAYNPRDEVLVPLFSIGSTEVTQSWNIVQDRSFTESDFLRLEKNAYDSRGLYISHSSGTAAPNVLGGTLTTAPTMSFQITASSTNKWLGTARKRFMTAATAGNVSGMRTAYGQWYRGSQIGYGGFFFSAKVGMQINLNGGQKFIGLCATTGVLAGEPSALLNCCGIGYDSTDASTGNWFFIRNNGTGSAVKVDLGVNAARNTTDGFKLSMFSPSGGARLFVKIENISTGNVVLKDSYIAKTPAVDTLLAFKAEVRNGAEAAADNIEVGTAYITSDY